MKIEIGIKSNNTQEDIFELKKFLESQNIKEFKSIKLRENPPQEGEMGFDILNLVVDLLPTAATFVAGQVYSLFFEKNVKSWIQNKFSKNKRESMSVDVCVKDEEKIFNYSMNQDCDVKVFDNVNFALNVDKTHVLLVGASEFDPVFPSIPPVKFNISDLKSLLTNKQIVGIPEKNIISLLNTSYVEVYENLEKINRVKDLETLIFYFAGHGHRTDLRKLFLITNDSRKVGSMILNAIDFDLLKEMLKSFSAKQKIIILDACHSGVATQGNEELANINVLGSFIVASSPGDEVSYFHREKRNTFFTGELISVIKNGLSNEKEYISLSDVYESLSANLEEKKLPIPQQKNELNIPATNFYLAHNTKFSITSIVEKADSIFLTGDIEKALAEYEELRKRFPNNEEIKNKLSECENEVSFFDSLTKGDRCFFKKEYQNALNSYEKALRIKKDDFTTKVKINKCKKKIAPPPIIDDEKIIPNIYPKLSQTLKVDSDQIFSVSYSPDGKRVLSGNIDGFIREWNLETGKCIHTIAAHKSSVRAVSYSPDGKRALSGSLDKTIKEWNLETEKCIHEISGNIYSIYCLSYSKDGRHILFGSYREIKEFDMFTEKCLNTFSEHTQEVNAVSYSPDGTRFLSCSSDKRIKEWDLNTGKCLQTITAHDAFIFSICYSADGNKCLSASLKEIKEWDLKSEKCLQTLLGHKERIMQVYYSKDGKKCLSASYDGTAREWNIETGKEIKNIPIGFGINSIAYSPKSQKCIIATVNGEIQEWELECR